MHKFKQFCFFFFFKSDLKKKIKISAQFESALVSPRCAALTHGVEQSKADNMPGHCKCKAAFDACWEANIAVGMEKEAV